MINRKIKKELEETKVSLVKSRAETYGMRLKLIEKDDLITDLKAIIKNRETRAAIDGLTNSSTSIYGDDYMAENHFDDYGPIDSDHAIEVLNEVFSDVVSGFEKLKRKRFSKYHVYIIVVNYEEALSLVYCANKILLDLISSVKLLKKLNSLSSDFRNDNTELTIQISDNVKKMEIELVNNLDYLLELGAKTKTEAHFVKDGPITIGNLGVLRKGDKTILTKENTTAEDSDVNLKPSKTIVVQNGNLIELD